MIEKALGASGPGPIYLPSALKTPGSGELEGGGRAWQSQTSENWTETWSSQSQPSGSWDKGFRQGTRLVFVCNSGWRAGMGHSQRSSGKPRSPGQDKSLPEFPVSSRTPWAEESSGGLHLPHQCFTSQAPPQDPFLGSLRLSPTPRVRNLAGERPSGRPGQWNCV